MAMRRFQMMLDAELDDALEHQAAQESVSKAELLRRYARERLKSLPPIEKDPLWEMVGIYDDEVDSNETVDDIVYGPRQ